MTAEAAEQGGAAPFITVVMPVRNEEAFIERILGELIDQDYPADRYEVIVADGESTDATRERVGALERRYPRVRLFANPGRLPSSGRNVGFRNGRGELFVVVDGHCVIANSGFLRNVAACFAESGAACLARPQPFEVPDDGSMARAIALARTSSLGHSTHSEIHSAAEGFVSPVSSGCAYRREVFEKVGYVDESFDACEDVEFNYRVEQAGFKAFSSPRVAVRYFPRTTLAALWRQLQRYGQGRARFLRKHPEAMNIDMIIPPAFAAGVVAGPFAGFIHPALWWAYLGTIALYLAITGLVALRAAGGNPALALRVQAVFFVIHFGLGAGLWTGVWRLAREKHARRQP